MVQAKRVERPLKKIEYSIVFASRSAAKGWQDLCASTRSPMVDAWDFLTKTPELHTPTNTPLKGELGVVTRDGIAHQRWQHKPTAKGDARIWFYVDGRTVYLEQVHTRHPNETK